MPQPQMSIEPEITQIGQMRDKPVRVDSKVFRFREQIGACRNLVILNRNSGETFDVERADIPELILGLQRAYFNEV